MRSPCCDGVDNDCDGTVDNDDALDASTWYADTDGDTHGDPDASTTACSQPSGYVADRTDCVDDDILVSPSGVETCNEIDDDCDGDVDENAVDASTWYADVDGDGYGAGAGHAACDQPSGFEDNADDCDDRAATVYPGAAELCDAMANDCDTASSWVDSDEDGTVSFESTSGAWSDETSNFQATGSSTFATPSLASDGTLWVCDGTYYAHVDVSADVDLVSMNGADTTTLNGAGVDTVITATGATFSVEGITLSRGVAAEGGCMHITGSSDVTLTDVTLLECEASSGSGGGLYIDSGTLTGERVEGVDCTATNHGGGLYADDTATVSLTGGTWTGNEADSQGGALGVDNAATLDLDAVTIDGNIGYYAGAIRSNGTVNLTDCTITDNVGTFRGGALSAGSAGIITATDTVFSGNDGGNWGGAVYCNTCAMDFTDCDFTGNTAGAGGAVGGGSLDLTATGGLWSGNSAYYYSAGYPGYGGAVWAQSSSVVSLDSVELTGNEAIKGGAIGAPGATLTLTDTTLHGNLASSYAAAIMVWSAAVVDISGGAITSNSSVGRGGGIYSSGSNDAVTIDGTTLSGNFAGTEGGAVYLGSSATLSLTAATVSDNIALGDGGGIWATNDSASVTIDTSSFDDNYTAGDGGALHLTTATVTSSDFANNDPDDTYNDATGGSDTWGTAASFSCSAAAGCQ